MSNEVSIEATPPELPTSTAITVQPPSANTTRPMFRICELRGDVNGQITARVAHLLAASVYDARQATKYAVHEAKALVPGILLAVISPVGRKVAVLMSGSGRRANALIARRAIRTIRQSLPDVSTSGSGRKARTSRPRTAVRRRR